MKRIITLLLLYYTVNFAFSQEGYLDGRFQNLEFTINVDDEVFIPSIAYEHYFSIGKKNKLFIGPGIRIFGISSSDNWRFAQTNAPGDNFKDGDENVNAFIADETRIAAINLGIYFLYQFSRFEIGLNTDLVGFTLSKSVSGNFETASDGSLTPVDDVSPQSFVLFPFDGSYNTEIIWFGYQISKKSQLKTGITFSDYKYEIPRDRLPTIEQEKNAYERIFTTFTLGYNYRF